ncbi:MAG: hypothetical protein M1839_004133, partial [Geoglossum umbratile]
PPATPVAASRAHHNSSGALEGRGKAVRERWPNKADYMAYYDYSEKRADDMRKREMTPISREDLKTLIATMNYNSNVARG